ncbi:hypothetical protein ACWDKQ_26250 [Saccharopolyspora sp. NPDC000995]
MTVAELHAEFGALNPDELRCRRSQKWALVAPDVLPAWVAEMDYPLCPVARNVLLELVERSDFGYPVADGRVAPRPGRFPGLAGRPRAGPGPGGRAAARGSGTGQRRNAMRPARLDGRTGLHPNHATSLPLLDELLARLGSVAD